MKCCDRLGKDIFGTYGSEYSGIMDNTPIIAPLALKLKKVKPFHHNLVWYLLSVYVFLQKLEYLKIKNLKTE